MRFAERRRKRLERRSHKALKRAHTRKTGIGRAAAAFRFSQVSRRKDRHDRRVYEWRHDKKKRVRHIAKQTGKHIAFDVLPFVLTGGTAGPAIAAGETAAAAVAAEETIEFTAAGAELTLAADRAALGEQVVDKVHPVDIYTADPFKQAFNFEYTAPRTTAAAEINPAARGGRIKYREALKYAGGDIRLARQIVRNSKQFALLK